MTIKFTKMQGCGNDYIFIDCVSAETVIPSPPQLAVRLSDRRFGVGGDGLVLILPSGTADARMQMFNADGSEGKMCGNAIRCVAKYLYDNRIAVKRNMHIDTASGVKVLELTEDNGIVTSVRVDMGQAVLTPGEIPVLLPDNSAAAAIIAHPVTISGTDYKITCVSMGNPHAVIFCFDVDKIAIAQVGTAFEHAPIFPDRVNAEFVQVISRNRLKMRVWERGSGETLACGTGACAAAVAAVLNGFCDKGEDIVVSLRGGELTVKYTDETVWLTGGCETVFNGVVCI